MSRLYTLLAVVGFVAISPPALGAQSNNAVTVNGVSISQPHLQALVTARIAQGDPDTPELRGDVRDYLIRRELLAQEAIRQGIESDPAFATQLALTKQSLLVNALLRQYGEKAEPTEKELEAEYERYKKKLGDKQYKTRHILLSNEDDAKRVISQLKKGADFTAIAKEKSIEPTLKKTDGVIDWATPSEFLQPISDVLAHLRKGQYTEQPVHTEHGWHIIKVEDERPLELPPFDQMKENLRKTIQRKNLEQRIAELRSKAIIKE